MTLSIEDYAPIVGSGEVRSIVDLAERVKGARVTHLNATRYGGGVAEILKSIVPLAKSVGLNVKWQVLEGEPGFFNVTKKLHNALQGDMAVTLSDEMKRTYLSVNIRNAESLVLDGDVVVIHDPQPLPLVKYRKAGRWVWRCHIDMSKPNPSVWGFVNQFVENYNALIFSREEYIPNDVHSIKIFIRHPCIDPLSEKNIPLNQTEVTNVLERYGVNPDLPILGQVARFDPWKNPLGAIDVYRMVKEKIPDVQLLLIGVFASDDPEAQEWYKKTVEYAEKYPAIHVLTDRENVKDREVNAFQRSFTVALQLSSREGFGLTVAEALWKGVPVVATRAGGIPLQVLDGVTGYLVNSLDEAAERATLLVRRSWLARILGHQGEDHVRRNFLVTKNLKDYLRMHIELVGK